MLEVFHSMLLTYAPKRQEFGYPQMEARMQLAAMDHNSNVNRQQAVVTHPRQGSAAAGTVRHSVVWSKATAQWVVKPIREMKSYEFATGILHAMVQRLYDARLPPTVVPDHIPTNIAPVQMPATKEEMVERHRTRFANR